MCQPSCSSKRDCRLDKIDGIPRVKRLSLKIKTDKIFKLIKLDGNEIINELNPALNLNKFLQFDSS